MTATLPIKITGVDIETLFKPTNCSGAGGIFLVQSDTLGTFDIGTIGLQSGMRATLPIKIAAVDI